VNPYEDVEERLVLGRCCRDWALLSGVPFHRCDYCGKVPTYIGPWAGTVEQRTGAVLFKALYGAGVSFSSASLIPALTAALKEAGVLADDAATAVVEWGVQYEDGSINGPTSRTTAEYLRHRDDKVFTLVQRLCKVTEWRPADE
jgi:hypothetical protein